ncbi:MAG: TlpA disulfide reductase family protein [Burkholderiaceae bacterium]|nr:TlpA disulfide reductase family protein [Burkholderiaceae bacterium]MDO9089347.1 TlpA disulfide reductase family protein [Burkholderiaceae bacterium]MDP1969062.1 TlpA disulfide reductase family protein [Burkholderiaceae bacterium]
MLTRRSFVASAAATVGAGAAITSLPGLAQSERKRAEPPLPTLGSRLALTPVRLLDDSVFQPAAAEGQVLVLYWWASWCPFCAVQSPHMEKLWQAQRGRGLQMLALSIDTRREAAQSYMQKKGYTFPAGMVTPAVARVLPKPRGLPVTLVRGRDGTVIWAESGEMFPEDVEGLAKFL